MSVLPNSILLQLNIEVTLEEFRSTLHAFLTGKAPGLDVIPVEFSKAFWELLEPKLLEVLSESLQSSELPLSCQRVVLTPLSKKEDPQCMEH